MWRLDFISSENSGFHADQEAVRIGESIDYAARPNSSRATACPGAYPPNSRSSVHG